MMRCNVCGIENESYMEFCKKCASELPRENRAPAPLNVQNVAFEPQPYDYRLPYRPATGYPEGYERPKPDPGSRSYIGPRPTPSRELPSRPPSLMHAQLPPLPMPEGRVMEAPIVRIPDGGFAPQRPEQRIHPQYPLPPQQQTPGMGILQPQEAPPQQEPHPPREAPAAVTPQAQTEQEQYGQGFDTPGAKQADPPVESLFDDAPEIGPKKHKQPRPPKKSGNSKAPKPDYDDPDDQYYDEEDYVPRRSGALNVVLYVSLAILLLAAVWFAGNYVKDEYGSVGAFVQTIFGAPEPEPTQEPLSPVEKIRIDVQSGQHEGKPSHRVAFYGTDGQQIELPDFTRLKEVVNGSVVFIALDEMFLPDSPGEDVGPTMQAKLTANLIDTDGAVYPLDVPEFEVEVPAVSLTLTKPGTTSVTLDQPQAVFEGKVSDNAKLIIDGSDVSELLDPLGSFSYTMEITEFGKRTVVIEAVAPRSRPAKATIELDYPKREVELQIDASVPDATTKDTVEVKGTTEAGATVEIEGTLEGEPTLDSSAGTFAFVCKLENYGLNKFTIKANKDGAESVTELEIEKKPDVQEYTPKARKMEYDSLSKNAEEQIGRIYLCEGKVARFLQQDPYPVFVFNVGGSKEQLIVMEYYGATKFDETKTYRIYGDVAGMDEEQELPKIIARFVYDKSS